MLSTTQRLATSLAQSVRLARARAGGVDALMLEFSLDSARGRRADVPRRGAAAHSRRRDARSPDPRQDRQRRLVARTSARRRRCSSTPRRGACSSPGKLVDTRSEGTLEQALSSLLRKGGEPLIRKGVDLAMRLLGQQFVTGRTIDEALANAREREARGYTFSYDMLGEAALTADDAERYFVAYEYAIHAIGRASHGRGVVRGPGHLGQALGAASALYARCSANASSPSSSPRARHAARELASATTSASTSTPRRPTASSSRSTSSRRSRRDPALAGLGRLGLRRAGVPEARARRDRLARRRSPGAIAGG